MNKYQKLASNTFVLALGQFGSKFLVYVMLRFYTSWLGADGFGDVNNIINASALLISVVTLSINEGVLRYALDDTIRKKNHVLSIGINVAMIGLVIFAAFVPLIGMIDMLSGYQWLIYMYVATGSIKGICAIYVRARGRVGLYAIDGTLTTIVVILLNILLLGVLHLGVVGYVLSISLGDMISIVFLTWRAGLLRQYRPLGNDRELAKGMIQYSVPLMPTAVMWWIINVSDTFMVTAIHGSAANGVYSLSSIYEAKNKTSHSLVTSIIGAATNIGLNLVLLNSPLGVIGAAVATLACYLLVYIIRAIDTRQFLTVNVDYLKMAINIMLISTMSVCIMTLDEGLLLNVLNCILFIILCAINFKTAAQAVKLFIRRRTGRGGNPEDGAENADK